MQGLKGPTAFETTFYSSPVAHKLRARVSGLYLKQKTAMSSRSKLIALVVVLVMVPTTILSYLQYESLLELQATTVLAIEENLRQVLGTVAGTAADELVWTADEAIGAIRPEEVTIGNVGLIKSHFERALEGNPAIKALFISSYGCVCPRKEYQFEETDVAAVVQEVVDTYRYPLQNAGFEIVTDIEPNLPAVKIDPDAMSQAVLNLINNAVKYSDEIKRVEVRVRSAGSHVAVEVADHGVGIPASEQRKIFEKFYRISTGLVHDRKGSGLGLALVEHIVKAHRGEIRVESTIGKGSRFTVLIPFGFEPGLEYTP